MNHYDFVLSLYESNTKGIGSGQLEDVKFDWEGEDEGSVSRGRTNKRGVLRAVVPATTVSYGTLPLLPVAHEKATVSPSISIHPASSSAKLTKKITVDYKAQIEEREARALAEQKQRTRRQWLNMRRNAEGVPLHTTPSQHALERIKQEQEAEERERRRLQRAERAKDRLLELKSSEGVKLVFDFEGKRVPEGSPSKKPAIKPLPQDTKEIVLPDGPPFRGDIIRKTERHLETMIKVTRKIGNAKFIQFRVPLITPSSPFPSIFSALHTLTSTSGAWPRVFASASRNQKTR